LSDLEVADEVDDPTTTETTEGEQQDRRGRRRYGLFALLLLLLLLLCCATTTIDLVVVRGPQQARFIARNLACLQCHTEKIPDFSRQSVHSPFKLKDCTVCHTPHGKQLTVNVTQSPSTQISRYRTLLEWLPLKWWFDAWSAISGSSSTVTQKSGGGIISMSTRSIEESTSMLVMPVEKLCWVCHGDLGKLLNDSFTHVPFEKGRCTECHDPHASDYTKLLTQPPNKLCFTCHPIGTELNRMQAHPPAKAGWCTDCHSPHASNFKGILIARQRELCFSCHPTVASVSRMPVQHQPFKNDNCTGCHEPHGSDTTPLLIKPQPALCYMCHPQIRNDFAKASHHPIGLKLTCASCHDPHAAEYPKLLTANGNEFCLGCHGDKEPMYSDSAHRVNGCVACHTPHGSAFVPMLVQRQPDLCLKCHKPVVVGSNKHPIAPKYFDVHAKKGLTCTSSCHNPHGTQYDHMVKNYSGQQDGMCMQCHKTVGVYY